MYIGNQNYVMVNRGKDLPHNYINSENPTVDVNPHIINMTWLNTTTSEVFVCVDVTKGSNRWLGNNGLIIGDYTNIPIFNFDARYETVVRWVGDIAWRSANWGSLGACFVVGYTSEPTSYYRVEPEELYTEQKVSKVRFTYDRQDYTDGDQGGAYLKVYGESLTLLEEATLPNENKTTLTTESLLIEFAEPILVENIDLGITGHRVDGTECSAMCTQFKLEVLYV